MVPNSISHETFPYRDNCLAIRIPPLLYYDIQPVHVARTKNSTLQLLLNQRKEKKEKKRKEKKRKEKKERKKEKAIHRKKGTHTT